MELINRYVREVGRRLPRKQRVDIENELHSSLEDTLDGRARQSGGAPDEALAVEVLKEFGPPARVAASYRTGVRHLIGPEWYFGFITTMKVCLIVLGGLFLLSLVSGLSGSQRTLQEVGWHLLLTFSEFQSDAFGVLGLVVLIFAIIERTADRAPAADDDWDPRSLPPIDDPDRLTRSEPIVSTALAVLFLFLLLFFQNRIGAFVSAGADGCWVPMLGPGFARHLPLLYLYLGGVLILNLVLLRHGRWNPPLRWADLALNLLLFVVFYRLALGPSVLVSDPETAIVERCSPEAVAAYREVATTVMPGVLKVGFTLAMLGTAVASIFKLKRAIQSTG
jgi:hypothetical protein